MKILCVCLGNICRSPTAEGILKSLLDSSDFLIDSAGTSAWHEGEAPDSRSTRHAALRGYKLEGASRAVRESDYRDFDLILAMDARNHFDLEKNCPSEDLKDKIKLITDFCKTHDSNKLKSGVPDPYRLGVEGFELVLDILEDACAELAKNSKQ